ncbi:MAG: hypothetical protein IPJ65_20295 [Archangiaceae bacterium]|nr:hypothetical protein [Archangiaceae bacterium]
MIATLVVMTALAQADAGELAPPSSLASELDAALGAQLPDAGSSVAPAPTPTNAVWRAIQSLNPDLAAIVDADFGGASGAPYSLAGDDPDLLGDSEGQPFGFALQEIEVALTATVDPFLRAELYLAIPNLSGIEVEEAVVTTTSLPAGLQLRAGIFRSAFGRQNGQHLHVQDFTRRPLVNEAFLGADGLRAPGLQASWLAPTPFFLQLSLEAFSIGAPEDDAGHLLSFGGGTRADLTYASELKFFVPVSDAFSIYGGLNGALGKTPTLRPGAPVTLEAVDLYLKYKPPNVSGGWFSVAWQSEVFVRQLHARDDTEPLLLDGGFYTQLVVQFARQWQAGARVDLLGAPSNELQPRVGRQSLALTFMPSEFARLRAYVERENIPPPTASFLSGPETWAGYLQLEVSIGAHGAHLF